MLAVVGRKSFKVLMILCFPLETLASVRSAIIDFANYVVFEWKFKFLGWKVKIA